MADPWALDDTDRRILDVLSSHGRSPTRDLAAAVGRQDRTVQERVARMEKRGVLRGYHATVDLALVGLPVLVLVEAYCPPDRLPEAARMLGDISDVVEAFVATGPRNVVVLARSSRVQDVNRLMALLEATPLEHIGTKVMVKSLVEDRPPGAMGLQAVRHAKPKAAAWLAPVSSPAAADRPWLGVGAAPDKAPVAPPAE